MLMDAESMEKVKFHQPDLTDASLQSAPAAKQPLSHRGRPQRLQSAVQARSRRLLLEDVEDH